MLAKLKVALLVAVAPFAALSGVVVVLARKVVKRGPKDYRRAELVGGGRKVRLDLDDYTRAPGAYAIFDPASNTHVKVGAVTRIDEERKYVERLIEPSQDGVKHLGPMVDWTPNVFFTPEEIGGDHEEVDIPTVYGTAPAWLFKGDSPEIWVIHVHGSWSDRSIMFRDVHAFKPWGFTSLVPSFRSDPEVSPPQTPSNHLGQTEWRDVESAVVWAVAQGARKVILSGWSMGGTISLLTAERSKHRELIAGVVLLGPVTSWSKTITANAARAGVPAPMAELVVQLLQMPWFARMVGLDEPLDFDALDWVDGPQRVTVPTLVMHSTADQEVPWEISEAFQRANPDTVTLVQLPASHHTQEWNTGPHALTRELNKWLRTTIVSGQE